MEFEDVVRTRRSSRGYRPQPVPGEVVREIDDVVTFVGFDGD